MTELQKYEKLLKENEKTIADLTATNKHIKNHIKWLKSGGIAQAFFALEVEGEKQVTDDDE